jgi:hypothetical protein
MPTARLIYQLRVELLNIEPVIWRELYVDENISLRQLHHILQVAFDWELAHPYQFNVKRFVCRDLKHAPVFPVPKGCTEESDLKVKLNQIATKGTRFEYAYDLLGNHWRHRIRVKNIFEHHERLGRAIAWEGEWNSASEHIPPTEYMQLTAVVRSNDRSDAFYDASERLQEYGRTEPDLCYLRGINAALARLANTGAGKNSRHGRSLRSIASAPA